MAAETIELEPNCTVVGTTFPPSDNDIDGEQMMRNGTEDERAKHRAKTSFRQTLQMLADVNESIEDEAPS